MANHRWNKLQQRLSKIIVDDLPVSFTYCPTRKKTNKSEITMRFFLIKLNDEIIWSFPKDANQPIDENFIYGQYKNGNRFDRIEFPIQSIIKYLDLPKSELLKYTDKAGLADILKVCDKRLGYKKLKILELTESAQKLFDERMAEIKRRVDAQKDKE